MKMNQLTHIQMNILRNILRYTIYLILCIQNFLKKDEVKFVLNLRAN